MNKQMFDTYYAGKDTFVHCKTKELAKEFTGLANSFGYTWGDGKPFTERANNWDFYKENTVYNVTAGFCSKMSMNSDRNIIEYPCRETISAFLNEIVEEDVDPTLHQDYYKGECDIETKDYIMDHKLNWNLGNVIKYVARAGKKDPDTEVQDLQKAINHLQFEIDYINEHKS